MKALQTITILPLVVVLIGYVTTTGATHLEDEQVYIKIGSDILQNPQKLEALQKDDVVETLRRYVTHRFIKMKIRRSLKFDISITQFRLGAYNISTGFVPQTDVLKVEVVVREDGKELRRFTEVATSPHSRWGRSISNLSKALSKNLYYRINDL